MMRVPCGGVVLALLGAVAAASPQPGVATAPVPLDAPSEIRIGVSALGSYAVRTLPLESYVAGVLVGEAARESAPAALDTLAIAIRTYATRNLRRHQSEGFDLCDQTHCQVLRAPTDVTEQSIARTAGQVLTYQGALASVFYSASCGGRTEVPSAVWPGETDAPYMPSQADEACEGQPEWSALLKAAEIGRALEVGGYRGSLRNLRIVSRHRSGRVDRLAVDGLTPPHITAQDLRMIVGSQIGWQFIKSTAFELERTDQGYLFAGRGYGHGVGLCVIGSTRLAEGGQSASTILGHYFPGADIGLLRALRAVPFVPGLTTSTTVPVGPPLMAPAPIPPPVAQPSGVAPPAADRRAATGAPETAAIPAITAAPAPAPSIPDEDARLRQELDRLTIRARQTIAATLAVNDVSALALRVHPTSEAYQRATGLPWFTLGAFRQGEIHLAPLSLLSGRGVLERIVRREITHALIDAELAHRPRWVRDGAALYYADSAREVTESRGPCPSDDDLRNPASAGALQLAYASARACFARQIASGRSWRDVR